MKRKYAICTLIKNEHLYLREWIDYHLSLGFSDFWIFEDNDSESHEAIVKDYDCVHLQNVLEFIGDVCPYRRQQTLFEAFLEKAKKENLADWILFPDLDEFLHLCDGYTLDMLTEEYADTEGLYLFWELHGCDGLIYYEDTDVRKRFPTPVGVHPFLGKTFANINKAEGRFRDLHMMDKIVNTDRGNHKKNEPPMDKAYIEHYITKSWEEWCRRFTTKKTLFPWIHHIENFFYHNPGMKDKTAELMSLYHKWEMEGMPSDNIWKKKKNGEP